MTMSEIEELRVKIDELEEELEGYDFGSYMYDVANGELEYSYARLDRLEKEEKNAWHILRVWYTNNVSEREKRNSPLSMKTLNLSSVSLQ